MSPRRTFIPRAAWPSHRKRKPVGTLRHRLVLQQPMTTDDGSGGETVTWIDVTALWAAVTPLAGSFSRWADEPAGELRLEVEIRHRPDVRPGMRFRARDGTPLFIEAVHDPDGTRHRLVCRCHVQPV